MSHDAELVSIAGHSNVITHNEIVSMVDLHLSAIRLGGIKTSF